MSTFQWITGFLKPYRSKLMWFVGCGLLITVIELSIVYFVKIVIDELIPNKQATQLYLAIVGFVVLVAIMLGAQAWRTFLQRELQELPSKDLILSIFRHLRRLGFSYYEQHPAGETLGLFHTEVTSIQRMFRQYVPSLIQHSITLIMCLAVIVYLSWQLSLTIVPFFLSYYLFGPYFEKRAALHAKEANRERQNSNKMLYDSISAIHEVRAYGGQQWSISRLIDQYRLLHDTQLKQYYYAYMRGTVRRITTGLGAAGVMAYGIYLVQLGQVTVGEFVIYTIFYFRVMNLMTSIVTLTTEQRILLQQAEALRSFMQESPQVTELLEPTILPNIRGEIQFKQVSFGYPSREYVLNQLSMHIQPGQKIALVGASGGGKSTVLKLIARFYDATEGELLVDGIPIKQLSFGQLRSAIGYVFQETYVFGGSVKDNIRFGNPDATDEEITEAAKAAYAHDFIEQLPNGYDTLVGERGIKLSGGQKQRIAIARMFIKNPTIVLLDEATSALDNVSEHEVQKALERLLADRTTIAVAHRLATVQHYDQLIVLDQGTNAEQGTYTELLQRGERFRQLVHGTGMEAGA
ncbi:ABC transporter ATP-binding protein [Paenibacillus silviterrae]|uniref:ABC transporter ATP-binding protein n=1 Tax=Paenibacillus silviterrae TaxID=3242194 RepID=UPI002543A1B1|nr:ABC transporter ATP-binding protein [Paenibacillus chinjuensis]